MMLWVPQPVYSQGGKVKILAIGSLISQLHQLHQVPRHPTFISPLHLIPTSHIPYSIHHIRCITPHPILAHHLLLISVQSKATSNFLTQHHLVCHHYWWPTFTKKSAVSPETGMLIPFSMTLRSPSPFSVLPLCPSYSTFNSTPNQFPFHLYPSSGHRPTNHSTSNFFFSVLSGVLSPSSLFLAIIWGSILIQSGSPAMPSWYGALPIHSLAHRPLLIHHWSGVWLHLAWGPLFFQAGMPTL